MRPACSLSRKTSSPRRRLAGTKTKAKHLSGYMDLLEAAQSLLDVARSLLEAAQSLLYMAQSLLGVAQSKNGPTQSVPPTDRGMHRWLRQAGKVPKKQSPLSSLPTLCHRPQYLQVHPFSSLAFKALSACLAHPPKQENLQHITPSDQTFLCTSSPMIGPMESAIDMHLVRLCSKWKSYCNRDCSSCAREKPSSRACTNPSRKPSGLAHLGGKDQAKKFSSSSCSQACPFKTTPEDGRAQQAVRFCGSGCSSAAPLSSYPWLAHQAQPTACCPGSNLPQPCYTTWYRGSDLKMPEAQFTHHVQKPSLFSLRHSGK